MKIIKYALCELEGRDFATSTATPSSENPGPTSISPLDSSMTPPTTSYFSVQHVTTRMSKTQDPTLRLPQEIWDHVAEYILSSATVIDAVRRKDNNGSYTLHARNGSQFKDWRAMLMLPLFHTKAREHIENVATLVVDVSNANMLHPTSAPLPRSLLQRMSRLETLELQAIHVQPAQAFSVPAISPGLNDGKLAKHLLQLRSVFQQALVPESKNEKDHQLDTNAQVKANQSHETEKEFVLVSSQAYSHSQCQIPRSDHVPTVVADCLCDIACWYLDTSRSELLEILHTGQLGGSAHAIVDSYGQTDREKEDQLLIHIGRVYEPADKEVAEMYRAAEEAGGQWELDEYAHDIEKEW